MVVLYRNLLLVHYCPAISSIVFQDQIASLLIPNEPQTPKNAMRNEDPNLTRKASPSVSVSVSFLRSLSRRIVFALYAGCLPSPELFLPTTTTRTSDPPIKLSVPGTKRGNDGLSGKPRQPFEPLKALRRRDQLPQTHTRPVPFIAPSCLLACLLSPPSQRTHTSTEPPVSVSVSFIINYTSKRTNHR